MARAAESKRRLRGVTSIDPRRISQLHPLAIAAMQRHWWAEQLRETTRVAHEELL